MNDPVEIMVRNERTQMAGWTYDVTVKAPSGDRRTLQVSLSFADYDFWCHGRTAPEHVVAAAVRYLLHRIAPAEMPARFDCAALRRRYPTLDQELPDYLGRE